MLSPSCLKIWAMIRGGRIASIQSLADAFLIGLVWCPRAPDLKQYSGFEAVIP